MRVGVFGAAGRVGREVCRAVLEADDLELVAAVDPANAGKELYSIGIDSSVVIVGAASELAADSLDAAVDFTHLEAARENLTWMAASGVHGIVGTTGFNDEDLDGFRAGFTSSNCLIAPNFTIGAVLMMRFAEMAAPFFESAEVLEFHHENKLDSPSGTAMMTVQRMAEANSDWLEDPTKTHVVEGARGGEGPGGIRVHAVRMRGVAANQEVILGTAGQTLTIRHDTIDRTSYMPGVLLALRGIADRPGLTMGLDALLGLS